MKLIPNTGSWHSGFKVVDGHRISFLAEDGRVAFEIVALDDGRSIQVRGVDTIKRPGGKLCSSNLLIKPEVANTITVSLEDY